ncbi:FAD-dependent oxidoreductase [Acidovorax sp. Leaf76]|uniref:NAD(P)/FAD-dependent oxidoreductase n=1 Tax=unclassified Acidovorax TaxID=2684926 RepID=UPI0006FCB3F5|nr:MULTISPECIES: FAD-dependent oxidoreductase [unclassified Acidovorax]KQO13587.1 FAD-dependent oxidoreductase [Acidovorax sp. Leaf76]KQO30806.1 FAD-dependent oxidoreductase [Acidovorax sp. Leaf84]KQS27217.1 FAD-dependent oxidoreductase [Acidovorax sp. Leaf191]
MSSTPRTIKTDVAIVGGGIVGASAALALRRQGVDVVLLERDLCGSRSSGVNYGGVRRQGRPLSQLPLAQRAHEIWARLPALIGTDGEYARTGHFKIARSDADMAALEHYADLSRDFDLGIELISGERLRAQCPWLGGKAVGGSLCVDDGQANPRLVSPAFALAAQRAGAQIFERSPLTHIEHDGRQLFTLHSGPSLQVQAPVVLNCAGAWAGAMAEQFGEPVPLRSGHPAMMVTEPLPYFMQWSLGVEGGGIYCRQVARGNLVLGGGSGFWLDGDRARSERSAIASLTVQAVELLPALKHAHFIRTWSGTEGYLPDRQPVLCKSRTTPGLIHGFGFAGAGFQIGPAVGEVLAELARDGHTSTPIDAFSLARFDEPPTPVDNATPITTVPAH